MEYTLKMSPWIEPPKPEEARNKDTLAPTVPHSANFRSLSSNILHNLLTHHPTWPLCCPKSPTDNVAITEAIQLHSTHTVRNQTMPSTLNTSTHPYPVPGVFQFRYQFISYCIPVRFVELVQTLPGMKSNHFPLSNSRMLDKISFFLPISLISARLALPDCLSLVAVVGVIYFSHGDVDTNMEDRPCRQIRSVPPPQDSHYEEMKDQITPRLRAVIYVVLSHYVGIANFTCNSLCYGFSKVKKIHR